MLQAAVCSRLVAYQLGDSMSSVLSMLLGLPHHARLIGRLVEAASA